MVECKPWLMEIVRSSGQVHHLPLHCCTPVHSPQSYAVAELGNQREIGLRTVAHPSTPERNHARLPPQFGPATLKVVAFPARQPQLKPHLANSAHYKYHHCIHVQLPDRCQQ